MNKGLATVPVLVEVIERVSVRLEQAAEILRADASEPPSSGDPMPRHCPATPPAATSARLPWSSPRRPGRSRSARSRPSRAGAGGAVRWQPLREPSGPRLLERHTDCARLQWQQQRLTAPIRQYGDSPVATLVRCHGDVSRHVRAGLGPAQPRRRCAARSVVALPRSATFRSVKRA